MEEKNPVRLYKKLFYKQGTPPRVVPIAIMFDHYGVISRVRGIKFIPAEKTAENKANTELEVVELEVNDAYTARAVILDKDNYICKLPCPVSIVNANNEVIGPVYYQHMPVVVPSARVIRIRLYSPIGNYIEATVEDVVNMLKAGKIQIGDTHDNIVSSNIELESYYAPTDIYGNAMRDVATDLATLGIVDRTGTRGQIPVVHRLPDSPLMIFPKYTPLVNIHSSASCHCSKIIFPEEAYSGLSINAKQHVDKIVLPKFSNYAIVVNALVDDLSAIDFPEKCYGFSLTYASSFETRCVELPKIDTPRYCFYSNFAEDEIIAYATGDMSIEAAFGFPTAGTTSVVTIHSDKPVDINLSFNNVCSKQMFLALDYVGALFLYFDAEITEVTVTYTSVAMVRCNWFPNSNALITFVCKKGGTPISVSQQKELSRRLHARKIKMRFITE